MGPFGGKHATDQRFGGSRFGSVQAGQGLRSESWKVRRINENAGMKISRATNSRHVLQINEIAGMEISRAADANAARDE